MSNRLLIPTVPASVAALPLLFAAARSSDPETAYASALANASAVVAADPELRNTRRRVALLICELASQYRRRTDGHDAAPLPISRDEIARAAGLSLTKVKRALALLELTRVIRHDREGLTVTDWRRLVADAHYPQVRFGPSPPWRDQEEGELSVSVEPAGEHRRTLSGEPAYFE